MELGYIMYWPDYQQYEDIPEFYEHAWHTDDADYQMVVVEKKWFDEHCGKVKEEYYGG